MSKIIYKNNQTLSNGLTAERKACQKERHWVLNVVLYIICMMGYDFLNLPKIVEAIYGSICKIFHAKSFPSISKGFSGRLLNPHSRNRFRQKAREMRKKKILSQIFRVNKQTNNKFVVVNFNICHSACAPSGCCATF